MNMWLEKRKVSLGGALCPIERERKPRKYNNCYGGLPKWETTQEVRM